MSIGSDPQRRILFTCLSESDPDWFPRVQSLVLSLRWFGGSCKAAPFVVNYVDRVPPEAASALSEMGAATRCVAPLRDRGPQNKLRMLDLHESFDFDVLVALDCDTVVVGDPAHHIPPSAIGAKPADYDLLTRRDWQRLYRALDITASEPSMRATSSGREIQPCFNSGVLTVPRPLCEQFRHEWLSAHSQVADALGSDSHLIPRHLHFFADQFSLAVCLGRTSLGFAPLPVTMNFPTHVPVHGSSLSAGAQPVILHYHDAVDDRGFLYRPRSPVAADQADAFNRARASGLDIGYSGLQTRPLLARLAQGTADRFWLMLASRQRLRSMLGGGFSNLGRGGGVPGGT
jgi:hypothetical protein